ncbi:MAG: hypothetical protein Q4D79_03975 [Propionibacteriaceae bacterium]|nr:hypothetical protein [Propionibacteriaceae bacterium]
MKRPLIASLVVVSALALASLPGPIAHAENGDDSPEDLAVAAAEAADNAALAEELGVPEEQAAEWFQGEEEFLGAVEHAKAAAGEQFFYAAWTPQEEAETGYKGWIAFKGEVSQEAVAPFAALDFPVEVRTNAEFTENELEQIRQEKMTALAEAGNFKGLVGDIESDGSITIQYEPSIDMIGSPQISATATSLSENSPVKVTVAPATGIAPTEEVLKGGAGIASCTLGFVVVYRGRVGALTAGHCPNSPGVPTGSSVALKFVKQHIGDYGDVQLHTSTDSAANEIRVSRAGEYRTITASGEGIKGSRVCNYGKTRALPSCTTIRTVNHAFIHPDTGMYVSQMVQTNGSFTNAGDSGGPWYFAQTARGIHFGKSGGYATYTSIGAAESVMDATVLKAASS